MKQKVLMIVIPTLIACILILGILYFVNVFSNHGSTTENTSITSFKSQKELFANKKQAYDAYISDSTINIRKENVSIHLGDLFKRKETNDKRLDSIPSQKSASNKVIVKQTVRNGHQIVNSENVNKSKPQSYIKANYSPLLNTSKTAENQFLQPKTRESFYSSSIENNQQANKLGLQNKIELSAVIHSKQTIYQGSTVKLRTTAEYIFAGQTVPINTYLYGIASISNERVMISVISILVSDKQLPIKLEAYDKDGIQGIYIPGLAIHDASKQALNDVASQAAGLNIPYVGNAIRNTVTNQTSKESVVLTDGYQVTLKNNL